MTPPFAPAAPQARHCAPRRHRRRLPRRKAPAPLHRHRLPEHRRSRQEVSTRPIVMAFVCEGDTNKKESETTAKTDTDRQREAHQKCFCVYHRGVHACDSREILLIINSFSAKTAKNRQDQNTSYWVCCKSRTLYRHEQTRWPTQKKKNNKKMFEPPQASSRKDGPTDRRRDSVRRCHASRHRFSTAVLPVHDYYTVQVQKCGHTPFHTFFFFELYFFHTTHIRIHFRVVAPRHSVILVLVVVLLVLQTARIHGTRHTSAAGQQQGTTLHCR